MTLSAETTASDVAWKVGFSPKGNGLTAFFEPKAPVGYWPPVEGQQFRAVSINVEVSKDHGIMSIPIRLPRYLMPRWTQDMWVALFEDQFGWLHSFMDECVVQGLSLAIVSDAERRKAVLQDAEQVIIDYRGDLPNLYLPMMLGGYKVGVYRRGNAWPIWVSIQPTYDLALKEAKKLCGQAGIPQSDKAIIAVEKLANDVKVNREYKGLVGFIQSDEPFVKSIRSVLALSIGVGILIGVGIGWLLFKWIGV